MARAGFVDAETAKAIREGTPPGLPVLPPDDTRRKGLEAIAKADMPDAKHERMTAVFNLYMDGKSFPLILPELDLSKGSGERLLALSEAEQARLRLSIGATAFSLPPLEGRN
jgi:hypothetical protein